MLPQAVKLISIYQHSPLSIIGSYFLELSLSLSFCLPIFRHQIFICQLKKYFWTTPWINALSTDHCCKDSKCRLFLILQIFFSDYFADFLQFIFNFEVLSEHVKHWGFQPNPHSCFCVLHTSAICCRERRISLSSNTESKKKEGFL